MGTFIIIVQLILALSILVILHELGHFIPARIFKIRVEKFYLFFNPWFSLFKHKKGDTEYGIGWLPLGGYVKLSGMIDESMDTEQMKKPPQPWEFRSKPAWQRLIVMIGGVVVNLILAVLIYAMISYVWGKDYIKNEDLTYGIEVLDENLNNEKFFQNGDKILTIGGEKVDDFDDITKEILINQSKSFTIERNGKIKEIEISDQAIDFILKNEYPVFFPRVPAEIDTFRKNSLANKIGLRKGDVVVGLNGEQINFFDELLNKTNELKQKDSANFTLEVLRNNDVISISGEFDTTFKFGVPRKIAGVFKTTHKSFSFTESFPEGLRLGYNSLTNYVKQFGLVFRKKEAAKKVGGFGSIAKLFKPKWNWKDFWNITAFLSIALAFLNILPIPALDGGHVMFLLYEIVSGKPPSEAFLEKAQIFGFLILVSLVLLVNGNDFYRWLTGQL